MVDPVLLPNSQMVMDRSVIERHIMANDDDPFTRAKLTVSDLIPQQELKEEIHKFCKENNISLVES